VVSLDHTPTHLAVLTPAFSGPPREELPIPNAPPYTAFVGNLAFETDEDALKAFFGDSKPISVRMIKDPQTGSSKGYGYVEFETQDGLKSALASTGQQIGGRNIRISVAEAREFYLRAVSSLNFYTHFSIVKTRIRAIRCGRCLSMATIDPSAGS
jgi:RNA recognition motif-containing protein